MYIKHFKDAYTVYPVSLVPGIYSKEIITMWCAQWFMYREGNKALFVIEKNGKISNAWQ